MEDHGINVVKQATSVSTPVVAKSGIPFVIGIAPVHSAETPAGIGVPVLCTSRSEAEKKLGYTDAAGASGKYKYNLCEFMDSHFDLYGRQPVIFCNLLDPGKMKTAVAAEDMGVTNHKILLPFEAIDDDKLIIKAEGGTGAQYEKDADYSVCYDGDACVIELLRDGSAYSAASLNVAYSAADLSEVTETVVATGLEAIELCMSMCGIVPDLICAPGFSHSTAVGAVMATKTTINGMLRAKALIDIDTGEADEYGKVVALKNKNNFTDKNQIVCWPMLKLGERRFHMSTQLAGLMAQVDADNSGCPYESPSNKAFKCDAMILADGTEINLTLSQANMLGAGGVVTALGFMGGLVCWGNYTACYPINTDLADYFIPQSRMVDWVGNTEAYTFWGKLDKPMNRRLVDSICDTINIWMNGLTGMGYLYGGRAEVRDEENPETDLIAGILRIHNSFASPPPMQRTDFILEYDVNYIAAAMQG